VSPSNDAGAILALEPPHGSRRIVQWTIHRAASMTG
jgi:hypothetical protein